MIDPAKARPQPIDRVLSLAGLVLIGAMGALVPLFFIPPSWKPIVTQSSGVQVAKELAVMGLGAAFLIVLAARILVSGRKVLPPPGAAPLLFALFVLHCAGAVILSPDWRYSLRSCIIHASAAPMILFAPAFVTSARRAAVLIAAVIGSGLLIALLGLLTVLGVGAIPEFIYGVDPFKAPAEGEQLRVRRLEGMGRSAANSTMTNPEYAGSLYAVMASLVIGAAAGWMGRVRRPVVLLGAAFAAVALIGAVLVATGTRGAWLGIAAATVMLWFSTWELPARWIAGGGVILAASLAFLGTGAIFVVMPLLLAAALVHMLKSDRGRAWWASVPRAAKAGIVSIIVLFAMLFTLYSLPGPWNPRGLRLAERFAAAASPTDFSVQTRMVFFMIAGEMAVQNPLFGAGPGYYSPNYHLALMALAESDSSGVVESVRSLLGGAYAQEAHNDYFQIAAETGIAGLLWFLGWITAMAMAVGRIARRGTPEWQPVARVTLAALACFLAVMLTSFPLREAARLALFACVTAIAMGIAAHGKTADAVEP